MRLTRKTRLGELLEAFPQARSVFQDNDIELEDAGPETSLSAIARLNEVDIEDLLAELREEIDPDDDDDDGYIFGDDEDDDDDYEDEDDDDDLDDLDDEGLDDLDDEEELDDLDY